MATLKWSRSSFAVRNPLRSLHAISRCLLEIVGGNRAANAPRDCAGSIPKRRNRHVEVRGTCCPGRVRFCKSRVVLDFDLHLANIGNPGELREHRFVRPLTFHPPDPLAKGAPRHKESHLRRFSFSRLDLGQTCITRTANARSRLGRRGALFLHRRRRHTQLRKPAAGCTGRGVPRNLTHFFPVHGGKDNPC
jgi:hypothetical protein